MVRVAVNLIDSENEGKSLDGLIQLRVRDGDIEKVRLTANRVQFLHA